MHEDEIYLLLKLKRGGLNKWQSSNQSMEYVIDYIKENEVTNGKKIENIGI